MPPVCSRCGNCHVRNLIYAPTGFRVLFASDFENSMEDAEYNRYAREFVGRIKVRNSSLREFLAAVNF